MDSGNPTQFFESAQTHHLICFCIFAAIILLVLIWGIVLRIRNRRSYLFAGLAAIAGIAIYFYSENVEHAGIAALHYTQTQSGPFDPVVLDYETALFRTALAAYTALAFLSQVVAALLLLIHKPGRAKQ